MSIFEKSKWIWPTDTPMNDEYAEFVEEFSYFGRSLELYISADSNYAVYLNGELVSFGQYADFPYSKVYDKIDLSRRARQGKNVLAIRVWYYGIATTSTYYPGKAALIFSVLADGEQIAASGEHTRSRISQSYVNHKCKIITVQLGLSFEYDSRRADAWMYGVGEAEFPFSDSKIVDVVTDLRPRSCKIPGFGDTLTGTRVVEEGIRPISPSGVIYDLGREAVGFICLKFNATSEKPITVAFGEHLVDGHVRRLVGGRDFSFIYHPTVGINYYMNAHRRFGCRYVEIISDDPIGDVEISLRPVMYPVNIVEPEFQMTPTQRKIYDYCVYTLQCCMHEHYEDCPWREQALYTMDSRNQMLSGYYAFGETVFPRANLELIAEDNRPDGLLSICYPIRRDYVIPSFSLHFITECEEYLRYSGDSEFIEKIYPKILSILSVFLEKIDTSGLIMPFDGANMWNFYEWCDGLDGYGWRGEYDVILNALLSHAISKMMQINTALNKSNAELAKVKEKINGALYSLLYDKNRGLFRTRASEEHYSVLGNSLAILADAVSDSEARRICEIMVSDGSLVGVSLSMKCFYYDALLKVDRARYTDYILLDIEKTYTPMLATGNGTVWETELGQSDFDNAGSLCHGWSAMPIYYYNILKD